jgi:hypothetical protein
MASQVFTWTIHFVRKLKFHRKPKHSYKVIPVREASISRPSLRRPSDQYSQRRAEVEPLPYPAESSQAGRSGQNGTTTHYYPHIYFQDGQYHTAHSPPLASAPTPLSRTRSPVTSPQASHPTAHQRSLTYPAASPRSAGADAWWADHARPASPRSATSGPRPGGGPHQATRPISPQPRMTAPPILTSPPRKNATPGPSRIPLKNVPGPSQPEQIHPVEPLPVVVEERPAIDRRKKRERDKKKSKSKQKQRAAEPPPRRDRIEFPPGRLPPAVQQLLHAQEMAREQEVKPLPEIPDYKPTAKFYLPNDAWAHYLVDPRFPPDDFPYERYLEMKKAELARERRLRKREKEREEKELALNPEKDTEASSRWPMSWIRRIFRFKRDASRGRF